MLISVGHFINILSCIYSNIKDCLGTFSSENNYCQLYFEVFMFLYHQGTILLSPIFCIYNSGRILSTSNQNTKPLSVIIIILHKLLFSSVCVEQNKLKMFLSPTTARAWVQVTRHAKGTVFFLLLFAVVLSNLIPTLQRQVCYRCPKPS